MFNHKTQDGVEIKIGMGVWFRPDCEEDIEFLMNYYMEERIVDSIEEDKILICSGDYKNITISVYPENIFAKKENMLEDRKIVINEIVDDARKDFKKLVIEGNKEIKRLEEFERKIFTEYG